MLHDFDYEQNPTEDTHLHVGGRILRERGYAEEMVETIQSHADYMKIPRDTPMKKAIYACDELVGFIGACVKVRPTKKIADLPASSVLKRLKDKAFARSVDRSYVYGGRRGRRGAPRGARRLPDRGAEADRRRDRPLGGSSGTESGINIGSRWSSNSLSQKDLHVMSTVETVSPRTIRARSILKDLSGEELRALARSGEKTTEYGSPVYATRIKNRSAKKTYVVADGVQVGVMQQSIDAATAPPRRSARSRKPSRRWT